MNEYKITFNHPGESSDTVHIIERTESSALRQLSKLYGKDVEISDTELVSTDATATKEQERESLEKIKAMVAELGPQSYLKTAFDGVFEDAEQNIEDDAAYSMKARLELQAQRAIERGYEVDQLEAEIKKLHGGIDKLTQKDEERKATIIRLEEERDELKKHVLPIWLHSAIYSLVSEELATTRQQMEQTAETMACCADAPQDIAFTEAVKSYRAAKERREVCEQIVKGLEALTEK